MKKSLALVGIAIAGILASACSSSSSSSEAPLAEKCAGGLSEECLEGATWNLNGLYAPSEDGSYQLSTHAFSSPSVLVFTSDKKAGKLFSLTYSTDPSVENIQGGEDSGVWSIENGALRLQFDNFGTFHMDTTMQINATIGTLGSSISLNLGGKILHNKAIAEGGIEIFTAVEK